MLQSRYADEPDLIRELRRYLCTVADAYDYQFTESTSNALKRRLFRALLGHNEDALPLLFPHGTPSGEETWILSNEQGFEAGAEFSEAARGKRCGHVFRSGEVCYRCRTCSSDETCVLCSRCLEASDHEGHNVTVTQSDGNKGCCDCGDDEAFEIPIKCAIHTAPSEPSKQRKVDARPLPPQLLRSVKATVSVAFDFICDIVSCSPEFLRDKVSTDTIQTDREGAELNESMYGVEPALPVHPEHRLIIWNDEKHTHEEVTEQVARACRTSKAFARSRANETDELGRSIVKSSSDIISLIDSLHVIEQIRLSVTIRSARETFREQMCGAMMEWLEDISRCKLGDDVEILQTTICEVLLEDWRRGSKASNALNQRDGLDDHQVDEQEVEQHGFPTWQRATQLEAFRALQQRTIVALQNNEPPRLQELNIMRRNLQRVLTTTRGELQGPINTTTDEAANFPAERVGPEARNLEEPIHRHEPDDANMMELDDLPEPVNGGVAWFPPPGDELGREAPMIHMDDTDVPQAPGAMSLRTPPLNSSTTNIPSSRARPMQEQHAELPDYWQTRPKGSANPDDNRMKSIMARETRLSWLLLFDLRLWKKARVDLRSLYIGTMVAKPEFKRVFGLVFARDYNNLAQLYLVGDREPDNSVVRLSVQLLTTQSIVQDLMDQVDFLSKTLALFYTFLTKRQVGPPSKVDLKASIPSEPSSLANRRLIIYFNDLSALIAHQYVKSEMSVNLVYIRQFLDLLSLLQGIFPNTRAIGEHVEYESESWFSASAVAREFTRLCRKFGKAFRTQTAEQQHRLAQAIRFTVRTLSRHCLGQEKDRFPQSETKSPPRFKHLQGPLIHRGHQQPYHKSRVIAYSVASQPMSTFHHLQFLLSWLLEQAKDLPPQRLHALLLEGAHVAKDFSTDPSTVCTGDDVMFAILDFSFRMPAWLAQERVKLWVRNGVSLRHQLQAYRGIACRKLTFNRDILLTQLAFSLFDPSRVLGSLLDRFALPHLVEGYLPPQARLYDFHQEIEVLTDFLQLIITVLTDRIKLQCSEIDEASRLKLLERDIIHVLCFKPLPYSKLSLELPEKAQNGDDFKILLAKVSDYHEPEGLNDSGMYELKSEYLQHIDPYNADFTKNQREEAELAYRKRMSRITARPMEEVVYEPTLEVITATSFSRLPRVVDEPLFAHIIFYAIQHYHTEAMVIDENGIDRLEQEAASKLEGLFQTVLHLILVATAKVDCIDGVMIGNRFIEQATARPPDSQDDEVSTILEALARSARYHPSTRSKVQTIIRRFQAHNPTLPIWVDTTYLQHYGITSIWDPTLVDTENEIIKALSKREMAARRKADVLAKMKQQQQAFMATFEDDEADDDGDRMTVDGSVIESVKHWDFPRGNCILCQENCDESKSYGVFGMMCKVDTIRETPMRDPDYLHELLEIPQDLDRAFDKTCAFGAASRNLVPVTQMKQNGEIIQNMQRRLKRGFPPENCLRCTTVTGCGHVMHGQCFHQYLSAVAKRHKNQIARAHPERLAERGEFLCPLCKSLNNIFLPVIWKSKQEVYPGVLQSKSQLNEYMNYDVHSQLEMHPDSPINFDDSIVDKPKHQAKLMRRMLGDARSKMFSKISSGIDKLANLAIPRSRPMLSSPLNPFGQSERPGAFAGPGLDAYYERIRQSIIKSGLEEEDAERYNERSGPKLGYHQTLARTLASSIAASELAQRGEESHTDSVTFIERISNQSITTMRVFADTILTYSSISFAKAMRAGPDLGSGLHALPTLYFQSQACALFAGSTAIANLDTSLIHTEEETRSEFLTGEPLISKDIFSFMVECMMGCVPAFELDPRHVMQLCYVAYAMKVMILLWTRKSEPAVRQLLRSTLDIMAKPGQPAQEEVADCSPIAQWVENQDGKSDLSRLLAPAIHRITQTYLLTFLRQTVLLMYVRFGVDFSLAPYMFGSTEADGFDVVMVDEASTSLPSYDPSAPELARLQALLRLPTLLTLVVDLNKPDTESLYGLRPINTQSDWSTQTGNYVDHWRAYMQIPNGSLFSQLKDLKSVTHLTLQHPGIPELASLPDVFDVLVSQCMESKCPTTGQPITDPAVCLLCGKVICTQTRCCTRGGIGPLNQHLRRCGVPEPEDHPMRDYPPYLKCMGYPSRSPSTSSNPSRPQVTGPTPATPFLTSLPPLSPTNSSSADSHLDQDQHAMYPSASRAANHAATASRCSGHKEYGIFMLIRKCSLLYLWGAATPSDFLEPGQPRSSALGHSPVGGLGAFAFAPYLDEHGETDQVLRRLKRLYLNRKRLDGAVRKVWLKGEIGSLVARRLDGEMGQGGWESF